MNAILDDTDLGFHQSPVSISEKCSLILGDGVLWNLWTQCGRMGRGMHCLGNMLGNVTSYVYERKLITNPLDTSEQNYNCTNCTVQLLQNG